MPSLKEESPCKFTKIRPFCQQFSSGAFPRIPGIALTWAWRVARRKHRVGWPGEVTDVPGSKVF